MRAFALAAVSAFVVAACTGNAETVSTGNGAAVPAASSAPATRFTISPVSKFDEPWAMTFLPSGDFLVTEKKGRLYYGRAFNREANGNVVYVQGVPQVDYGGQLGLGDVIAHPDFAGNKLIYLSWSEPGPNDTRGAAVGRARLVYDGSAARLENLQVIWRQDKVDGRFHHAHRLAFSPDRKLFITSGDRMKFEVAQGLDNLMGKVIRLNEDGSVPRANPFARQGGAAAQIWSLGHRNPLGIAFDRQGQLWTHEMGPRNGDEFNRIERGSNYGWPTVSNGSHYDGRDIPDHATQPRFNAPEITWNGVSPAGLMIYSGNLFPTWRGNAFLGGLSGKTLIRVELNGSTAREAQRWDMGARIREVEQGPDGAIYLLEDERGGSGGRLLRLTPAR